MAQAELDPRIPLSIEPIKFPTADELEERRLKLEQARQVRQAAIDAAADRAAVQTAFQTHMTPDGPDFKGITNSLYASGRANAAKAIEDGVLKMRKEAADQEKTELENHDKEAQAVAQLFQGVDASSYPTRINILKAYDPKGAELLGETYDKQKVDAVVSAGTSVPEHNKQIKEATDLALSGKIQEAMGREVDLVPNDPEAWSQFRAKYIHFGADPNTIPQQPSPEVRAAIKQAAISPEKQAEFAGQQATREQTAANQKLIDQREQTRIAQENQRLALEGRQFGLSQQRENRLEQQAAQGVGPGGIGANQSDAKAIADAIAKGDQPPSLTGLYRYAGPVRAELAKQGYDLTRATEDWNATQRYLGTLNGAQQIRLRQAVKFTHDSLDVVDQLNQQWQGGRFPLLNKANLALAKNGALGPNAQSIATQLDAQISDLVSELGTVYKGGNSSTDESLKLAAENLKSNWSQKQLSDAINLVRKNLTIRENSIKTTPVVGGRQENPYAPESAPKSVKDPMGIR